VSKSVYPTAADIQAYLTASGIVMDGSTADSTFADFLGDIADAGKLEFERRTDRKFLADTADMIYYFNPPADTQGVLFLNEIKDLISVTSIVYQPTGSTALTLTLNTDYWLEPANNLAVGRPYEWVQFRTGRFLAPITPAQRRSIIITGKAGYAAAIPTDAWRAMISCGLLSEIGTLAQFFTGGLLSWRGADGTTETYKGLSQWGEDMQCAVDNAAARYRRVTF